MNGPELNIDWQHWYDRWEAMQNCYIPERLYRFKLMFELAEIKSAEPNILDLGCGPGSLSFSALELFPQAKITAVDFDRLLLTMGRKVAGDSTIRFLETDMNEPSWWEAYDDHFDLVVSATALHWLDPAALKKTYMRIFKALKPGGAFMLSDHIASDSSKIQKSYDRLLQDRQKEAFEKSSAFEWDHYWDQLKSAAGNDLSRFRDENAAWAGHEEGQPKSFHFQALQTAGFKQLDIIWQDLGEAVLRAIKGKNH